MYNLSFDLVPVLEYIAPLLASLGVFIMLWIVGMVLSMVISTRS